VPLAFLIIDVDRLKAINDGQGHSAGDRALVAVATAISQNLRIHDTPVRYGGDEFAVLCPHTDGREAEVLAERIRETVQGSVQGMALSVSIGIETVEGGSVPAAENLVAGADRALYAAKEGGRNRTCRSRVKEAAAGVQP
jgi:diguanylate cyclase (GGDEF)-like protein